MSEPRTISRAAAVRTDCSAAATDVAALADLRGAGILVTGGTGFMGTWLAEMVAYLNDAHGFATTITLLSRDSTAFRSHAPHLADREDVVLVEQDVREISDIVQGVSFVVHAAGTPDNRVHATDPIGTMDTIAQGASAVLAAASRSASVSKVMMVSSGLIYGPQPLELSHMPEGWVGGPEPDSIHSLYAEAKRYAEAQTAAWRSQFKLPVVTVRPFAFIGPYQGLDKPWAVNNFLRDALTGGPIRILGDEETARSYMYPSDMAFWLLRVLVSGVPGCAYNIGSPEAITLGELARDIARAVDPEPRVEMRAIGEPRASRFVPDVSRVQSSLGLSLTVDLEQAIARTLAWHRADDSL